MTTQKTTSRCRVPPHAVEQEREETVRERVRIGVRLEPGIGPVRRREREQGRRRVVEIRPEPAELPPLTEERAEPLLVAPTFREELVAPFTLEVAPLPDKDRRDIELLRDDPQVRAQ